MPVETYEGHPFSGKPAQLYEFIRTSGGQDFLWNYTSADRDLWYNDALWRAIPISDDGVKLSSEAQSTELTVKMPIAEKFCEQFRLNGATPSDTVWLRVRRIHGGDITHLDGGKPTVLADALVTWIGTVNGINQTTELEAQVRCSMLSASFKRGGLRYGYQKNCPHVLYGPGCKVNRDDFKVTGDVSAIDGNQITIDGFDSKPDGYFAAGFIEYQIETGMVERRMVLASEGDTVSIMGLPVGIVVGGSVTGFAGCDLTIGTCRDKFNNLANMGGFPHSPGRNPFDGQPVF